MNLDERAQAASQGLRSAVIATPMASTMPTAGAVWWRSVGSFAAGFAAIAVLILVVVQMGLLPDPTEDAVSPELPTITLPGIDDPTLEPLPVTETTVSNQDSDTSEDVIPVEQTESGVAPEEADTTPPALVVTSPKHGQRFDVTTIAFTGTSEPGAIVTAGRYEADMSDDGNWSIVLVLSPGPNRAVFTATDEAGNLSSAEVTVHYDEPVSSTTTTTKPPKEETTTTTKPIVEFSANQKYGSCSTSPPFDVFWGTAQPGTVVSVSSPYGSGSVEANADGHWELKVYFETAPANEAFGVKVKSLATGAFKEFSFKYLPA